jgi:hypothetical protein
VDIGRGPLRREHLLDARHGRQLEHAVTARVGGEHRRLGRLSGIAERDAKHETVLLGLGQRVGALVVGRVLCGEHQERLRELVGYALDRYAPLLHALEQSRLRLGGARLISSTARGSRTPARDGTRSVRSTG